MMSAMPTRSSLRAALHEVSALFGPAARETILCENERKHLTELRWITRSLPREGRLIDLGGGVGVNLLCLRQLGYTGELVLVDQLQEYDEENRMGAAVAARTILADHEITLNEHNFWPDFSSGYDAAHFDVATCFDVVEHLPGPPFRQISELARILKPGGCFVMSGPNSVGLVKRVKVLAGRHPYMPFEDWLREPYFQHYREYSPPEYAELVRRMGLRVIAVERSAAVPLSRAANRYHRRKHSIFSPVTAALALNAAVEAIVPALRHAVYVISEKPA